MPGWHSNQRPDSLGIVFARRKHLRSHLRAGARTAALARRAIVALAALLLAGAALALDDPSSEGPTAAAARGESTDAGEPAGSDLVLVAVLPFRVHSAKPLEHLAESMPELLATRLAATGKLEVVEGEALLEVMPEGPPLELSDRQLRELAKRLHAVAVVAGSVTELAGRFSLDVRITPAEPASRSHTLVFTAESDGELVGRLGELSEQVTAVISGDDSSRIVGLNIVGAGELEAELRSLITSQAGMPYDPLDVKADRDRIEAHDRVARLSVDMERKAGGIVLTFSVVRSEMILGQGALARSGEVVAEIAIRGNRRIEADAIRTRIRTQVGEPLGRAKLARDVREVHSLGFFQNVYVFAEGREDGLLLIFDVEENPVIRQIAILGNDSLDVDKITDVLTLTTGSSLDHPLLHENTERIRQLYRAEGYFLAEVGFELEQPAEGSVTVNFEVTENEKLKLRTITFEGNEAFSDKQILGDFATKRRRFWSWATSWFDRSGTYSEPIFGHDLSELQNKYRDAGHLQMEIGEPKVDANEEGLFVEVEINEGPRFTVGEIDVSGDETVDLVALRKKLRLSKGDIFNRSFLTKDVEALERHYTDRGFFLASVQPATRISQDERTVDVQFVVEKGPLYFVRNINISGNTRTIDPVIRREMNVVEGQLYSARGIALSTGRIRRLGYFEDVSFEPQPADDPSQLDLNVNVVERPTGSFSFGAGYSSQDKLVFTASLSQSNLFGRGYFVNATVDIGGQTSRYFLSLSDPYFLGSTFSLAGTLFLTDVSFDTFEQHQRGFNFSLGHALSESNDARGSVHYSWASREIRQPTGVNAAAPIFREILQGNESSSILGISVTRDTRNDRFAATRGTNMGSTLEYSGLGGFAKFLRAEMRFAWYLGAPSWMIDRSTFVLSTRLGYAQPFNDIGDWQLLVEGSTLCDDPSKCVNVARLDQIDTDLRLPLTERYFLGGIGNFQLRGYRARSVGPRRAILQRTGITGEGNLFHPVGTSVDFQGGQYIASCADDTFFTQGDGDGVCNALDTEDIDDFGDLDETDVVGGNSFISSSAEYRFPISEEVGLQGVFFVDGGNAFYEGQNLFDASEWRYGYGGGVLWFSPFGPLQLVLGFPVDPESFEESPVFEFSVGGFGL